jgi:hypothetical protein
MLTFTNDLGKSEIVLWVGLVPADMPKNMITR